MIEIGGSKVKITSSCDDPNEYLIIRVGRQDTIDDIVDLCLRHLLQKHSNRVLLVIEQNDSRDRIEGTLISLGDVVEYAALGEAEDGTKLILVPVELAYKGVRFRGAQFIVEEEDMC